MHTWFLTLSAADMQWPEVILSIAHQYGKVLTADDVKNMPWVEKCKWLRSNPVTASHQFKHRLDQFFKEFIGGKANPIGELQDYMIRIEFQARGSPHAHTILWIKDALNLMSILTKKFSFIDKYQTCVIPDEENTDLRNLVLSFQKHVHSSTCRKRGSCRFRFPHPPSGKTLIARRPDESDPTILRNVLKTNQQVLRKVREMMEDKNIPEEITLQSLLQKATVEPHLYERALELMKSGIGIKLQRQPSERWINQYNPKILQTWRANMDLQFIADPYSCIMYITSYMMKSERAVSELLKKVANECREDDVKSKLKKLGSVFLNNREVSAQEAAFRLLSLPLKYASRKVVFVNTAPRSKRMSMLNPQSILETMDDNDEDIFCTSLLDRYASRPNELENMSLAEFAATYTTGGKESDHESIDDNSTIQQSVSSTIKLKNGLGRMRKRKRHCVIRYVVKNIGIVNTVQGRILRLRFCKYAWP